ncbi:hypothetical protein ACFFLM_20050 [Deinococcus oregonensis]|uniref:Uncharacterized protein n=1 Tax=Deinococcus oregonensis TaxID=1805970 RepID=A0ABV6B772_9DEIO
MTRTTQLSRKGVFQMLAFLTSGLPFASQLAGAASSTVTINGKATILESVVVGGKTYVSLDALKKALAAPMGGANAVAANAGCLNKLLFSGVWRFRVQSVTRNDADGSWDVKVELRNGTQKTMYSGDNGSNTSADDLFLGFSGDNNMSLGINATNAAQDTLVYKTLPPGGASFTTLKYYTDNAADKPTKFLWKMQKVAGLPFGKEAAFRVDLTCKK